VTPNTSASGRDQSKRTEQLHRILIERRRAINDGIRGHLAGVHEDRAAPNSAGVVDEGEAADVDMQADLELAFLQIKFQTLKQIDDALARLQRGLYGTCVECGDEIPAARLRALPFAVRCLDCEDDREALEKRAHALQRRTAPFQGILDNVS
jgi:RNA polymerase-binding transcription factor